MKKLNSHFLTGILLFFTLFLGVKDSKAQISSTGKTFYMSFMEMETRSGGYPDTLLIFVTSPIATSLVLDNPRLTGSALTYTIQANKVNRIAVDANFYYPVGSEFNSANLNSKRGLRIVAKDPVNVYCMNLELNRSDGTFILPYESIPAAPEFYVCSFPPNAGVTGGYAESEFVIVGMDNSVTVEITPTAATKGGATAGTPYTVSLIRGQVYQVQSKTSDGTNNTDPAASSWATTGAKAGDLTGTRIRVINGCGKINVFSGNRSAHVTKGNCGAGINGRDHLYTQVLPTNALGKDYVLMPFKNQSGGYAVKVVAAYDNTVVTINGTVVATIATKGQWIYQHITSAVATCINTSKPAYVVQYMKNGVCSGLTGGAGDPAIFISPDVNQRLLKTTVGTATTSNMNQHWVNVLIDKGAKNAVFLNGTKVASTSFTDYTCNGKNYSYAQLSVANPSSNVLACDSGMIVVAYGVGPYESYSYSAGALFENVEFDFTIARKGSCPSEPVTLTANNKGTVKAIKWEYGDGSAPEWGTKVTHKFSKIGAYYIVMKCVVANSCGIDDTITRSKILNVLPGPYLNFPDTTTQCAKSLNYTFKAPLSSKFLYQWSDGSKLSSLTVTADKKIWLKITDTSTNCIAQDTTYIRRADPIIAKLSFDTLNKCYKQNYFSMSDGSIYTNDKFMSSWWYLKDFSKKTVANVYSTSKRFMYTFDTLSSNPLRYIVESSKGCRDTLDTMLVVYSYPIASVKFASPYFCQKRLAVLYDSSYSDQKIGKTFWTFGDGFKDTSYTLSVQHGYKNYDTFGIRMITETVNGCRDTLDSMLIVYPVAKTSIGSKIVNLCLKQNEFEFYDNSTIPFGTFTDRWIVNGSITDNQGTLSKVKYTDTGFKPIILITKTDKGCSDTTSSKVYVAPEPKANFTVTDSNFCFKTHFFDLKDLSTAPNGNSLTARSDWLFSDGTNAYAKIVPGKTFSAAGTYWCRVICSTTLGCKDSFQRNLEVTPSPSALFTPQNALQCLSGNKFKFRMKTPWTDSKYTISNLWNLGDGNTSNKDSVDHTYTVQKAYWVKHTISTNVGCWDTASTSAQVVNGPVPQFTVNKDTACFYSQKFDFSDKTVFGSPYTVFWEFGDGSTANTANYTNKTYSSSGVKQIKTVVTSGTGCKDSIYKTVEIFPVPVSTFSVNKALQCLQNNQFIFTNVSNENAATGCVYTWNVSKPFKNLVIKDIPNQTFIDTGVKIITLTVASNKGCKNASSTPIYVAETPQVSINGNNSCVGEAVNFGSNLVLNVGFPTYLWTFGDGGTSALANPVHTYLAPGSFAVKLQVTSSNGCVGNATDLPVTAYLTPKAGFTSEYLLSRGLETDWKFVSTSTGADNYEWTFEDGQADYTGGPVFMTFNKTGNFKVRLLVKTLNGCVDSTSSNIFLKPELLFYLPNAFSPNIDGLNEKFGPNTTFGLERYSMMIYDRWGNEVFKSSDPNTMWDGNDLNGDPVMEGVYIYAVNFRYIDGKLYVYKGNVTILRP